MYFYNQTQSDMAKFITVTAIMHNKEVNSFVNIDQIFSVTPSLNSRYHTFIRSSDQSLQVMETMDQLRTILNLNE